MPLKLIQKPLWHLVQGNTSQYLANLVPTLTQQLSRSMMHSIGHADTQSVVSATSLTSNWVTSNPHVSDHWRKQIFVATHEHAVRQKGNRLILFLL